MNNNIDSEERWEIDIRWEEQNEVVSKYANKFVN